MSYDVRTAKGGFELLSDDRRGRGRLVVLALRSGKAWTYSWPMKNRGGDEHILAWVAGCNLDYVAKKFGAHDWFDARVTVASVRDYIVRRRREGRLTRDQARALWESLDDVTDEGSWTEWLTSNRDDPPEGQYVPDAWDYTRRGVQPLFREAWAALVPPVARRTAVAS